MNDRSEFVAWFRPELVQAVDWGGDPHNAKLAATEGDHVRLSPRRSFDLWRETIRGRAEPWDDSAVQAAQRFTRHLGAALLRYERDSASLARDLQRVMRPEALPALPGYVFSVFSQSAGRGEIGGDWYDVFTIDDDLVAVIVGDVAGHGLVAASEMAQLRNVLRAYLTDGAGPADALERLDRYMLRNLPGSIATVVCAVIDTAAGRRCGSPTPATCRRCSSAGDRADFVAAGRRPAARVPGHAADRAELRARRRRQPGALLRRSRRDPPPAARRRPRRAPPGGVRRAATAARPTVGPASWRPGCSASTTTTTSPSSSSPASPPLTT